MRGSVTDPVDPEAEALRDISFQGTLGPSDLPRLREQLYQDGTAVGFQLRFHRDEDGRSVVTGRLQGALALRCQRCLQPLTVPVDHVISLAVVTGIDEGRRLPSRYEPLLLESRSVKPIDLLEDEMILLVPLVPRHEEGECRPPGPASEGSAGEGTELERAARRPFAQLADWKRRGDRSDST
jgi:uncharacterized protein